MKRLLSFVCCMFAVLAAQASDVVVKSGNPAIFNMKEKVELVIDYSVADVNGKSLDDYLESRGADFVRDWPNDAKKAREYFVVRFNKKNKNGLQITETGSADYKMVLQVKTLDMGNGGSAFNPFASVKAGGVIVSGYLEIINKATGKSLCCMAADDVKGVGHPSETVRLGMAYFELASKILKETKDAADDGDFVESEPITVAGGAAVATASKASKAAKSGAGKGKTTTTKAKAAAADEAPSDNAEQLAVLRAAKGKDIPRRRKPVVGKFDKIAKQSKIGTYIDFSNADIDGRSEDEFIQYMETMADDDDLDRHFGENWDSMKEALATTFSSYVNKELKEEKEKLRFTNSIKTAYVLKIDVVSVDEDGNNKINYLFVNMATGDVEAQITCESKGGHFGRYTGLLKQGFESGGEDFAELFIDEL